MPESKQWWVVCTAGAQRRVLPLRWFYQYTQVTNYVTVPLSPPTVRGVTLVADQLVWLLEGISGVMIHPPFEVWLQQTPTGVHGWVLPTPFTVVYEDEGYFESHEIVSSLCI